MPAVRSPGLKVRTPASQAGNDGFEVYAPLRSVLDVVHRTTAPRRSYGGYRIMVVRQIVALLMGRKMSGGHLLCADRSGAETDSLWSPFGWVCLEARLLWSSGPCLATTGAERRPADCKSVTQKHRRFDSCPIHFPFACPRGLWCHSAKVVCGDAPKVQILPQTC